MKKDAFLTVELQSLEILQPSKNIWCDFVASCLWCI